MYVNCRTPLILLNLQEEPYKFLKAVFLFIRVEILNEKKKKISPLKV